jgi:hypothetical protein
LPGTSKGNDLGGLLPQGEQRIALATVPQVSPFPSAEVDLARLGPVAFQYFASKSKIVRGVSLLNQIHVGCVGRSPRVQLFGLGSQALFLFISSRLVSLLPAEVRFSEGFLFSQQRPTGDAQTDDQRQEDDRSGCERQFISQHQLFQSIRGAGRTGHHQVVVGVA